MSTTEYFSESLKPVTNAEIDEAKPSVKVELLVSSYSGEYAGYFKLYEDDGTERVFSISVEQLKELAEGASGAHDELAR